MTVQPTYHTFDHELEEIFRDDLSSYSKGVDIYRALCNTIWEKDGKDFIYSWRAAGELVSDLRNRLDLPVQSSDVCQNCGQDENAHIIETKEFKPFWSKETLKLRNLYCSDEKATRFVPGYSGKEDYLDFYCSGGEGEVAEWIKEKMYKAGYSIQED